MAAEIQLAELVELYIYPIKSLPGVRVENALVTPLGLVDVNNRRVADRYIISML